MRKSIILSVDIISADLNSVERLCWTSPMGISHHHFTHSMSNSQKTIQCSNSGAQNKDWSVCGGRGDMMAVKNSGRRDEILSAPWVVDKVKYVSEGLIAGKPQTTGKGAEGVMLDPRQESWLIPHDLAPGPPWERFFRGWISVSQSVEPVHYSKA